jgi:hypothetical protein
MVSTGCDHLRAAQPVTRAIRFYPTQRGTTGHLRRRSQPAATMNVTRRSWLVLALVALRAAQPLTRAIRFSPTQRGTTGHLRRRSHLRATMSVTRRSW